MVLKPIKVGLKWFVLRILNPAMFSLGWCLKCYCFSLISFQVSDRQSYLVISLVLCVVLGLMLCMQRCRNSSQFDGDYISRLPQSSLYPSPKRWRQRYISQCFCYLFCFWGMYADKGMWRSFLFLYGYLETKMLKASLELVRWFCAWKVLWTVTEETLIV